MGNERESENRLGFKKTILLVFLLIMLVAGIGYKTFMTTGSKTFAFAGVVISLVGFTAMIILFNIFKNKARYRYIVGLSLFICLSIIGVNIYYLKADYFIPHESTSYHNRNAQYSLRSSFAIEKYLKDKIVYMDSENLYYDSGNKMSEYPTILDIVTMNFTSKAIEVYPEKIDIIEYEDMVYFLSFDEKDYVYIAREDNWNRDVYFYIGDGYEQSDEMILLCDMHERMFFVTPKVYDDFIHMIKK